jgi:hypothetical protein
MLGHDDTVEARSSSDLASTARKKIAWGYLASAFQEHSPCTASDG